MVSILLRIINKLLRISRSILIENPLSISIRKLGYEQLFSKATGANLFRGVFSSFSEAVASAPSTKPIGYDHPEPAGMYVDRTHRVYSSDYPVLFWIRSILKPGLKIFDLGGHIGVSYYAYQKYLEYPDGLQWLVCDVPEVTQAGEKFAKNRQESRLKFTNDYAAVDSHELLLASGSLQYIEESLAELLEPITNKPGHIIVNLLPAYEGEPFVTLQNIGTVFCPYRIVNTVELLGSMQKLGYECVDIWRNEEKECLIPFHPDRSLDVYHGFYFREHSQ